MDYMVVVSPLQPTGILVKNATDAQEALRKALHMCWVNYPGFFLPHPQEGMELPYKNKFVTVGYPMMEAIEWQ